MQRTRYKSYYQKFISVSLIVLLFMILFQSMIYNNFFRKQIRSYVSKIASLVLDDVELNVGDYFAGINEKLDMIYQEPRFLATLNDDGIEPKELYARRLLSNTKYFRSLSGVYIYNSSNQLRSGYRRRKEAYAFDVISEGDKAAQDVLDYIENGETRVTVLCCHDKKGIPYIRMVKRLYQNAGYLEVGYIVCDFKIPALTEIVENCSCTAEQSVWILTENGQNCFLSEKVNENAVAYMQDHPEIAKEYTAGIMIGDDHYLQTELSDYGIVVCIFTDGIELRKNYIRIMEVICQSSLLVFLLYIGFGYAANRRIRRRTDMLNGILAKIADGEKKLRLPVEGQDEISAVCLSFNATMDQLDARLEMEEEMKNALNEARYRALQSQVNPHFLYNTMETIGAVALSQNCEIIDDMCMALSKMMRYNIEIQEKCVTLRQEVDYVNEYMLIIGVRMQNEINMEIKIDDCLWGTEMPRLSIQPLVENSIRHGLKDKRGEKKIEIAGYVREHMAVIAVRDNGIGISEEKREQISKNELKETENHTSIGIRNIDQRIQMLCGKEYGLEIGTDENWTEVRLKLPYKEEGKK